MRNVKITLMKVWALFSAVLCILLTFGFLVNFFRGKESFQNEAQTAVTKVNDELGQQNDDYFLILDETTGKILKVSEFDYVRGAVAAEMPPTFHIEALKAQALSAYTRALYLRNLWEKGVGEDYNGAQFSQNPTQNEGFLFPENAKKLYGENFDIFWNKMTQAANYAVQREIVFEDEPILAAYHAMSAGVTEDCKNVWSADLPYLRSVESEGDILAGEYNSSQTFSFEEARKILKLNFPEGSFNIGDEYGYIKVLNRSDGGYVVNALAGGKLCNGADIRKAFSLRSACFTVDIKNNSFVFNVRGYGHGVGLSQNGADFMARQGVTAEKILEHYYKGAAVKLKTPKAYDK